MVKGIVLGKLAAAALTIGAAAKVLVPVAVANLSPSPAASATTTAKTDAQKSLVPVSKGLPGLSGKWPLTGDVVATSTTSTQSQGQSQGSTTPAAPVLTPLLPLDLSSFWLWNWSGKWIGSEWGNGNSPLPWKFDHVAQPAGADTLFTLDGAGGPQIQAGTAEAKADGLWEADVTLPQLREGLIVAPLWLYDPASRDEVDFEFAGRRGLDVSMHSYVNGAHVQNTVRLFAGTDLSGQRKRFGIKVDQATGFVEMYVDGVRVHRWDRSGMTGFITHPVKPWIEMWAANPWDGGFVGWAGSWTPLAQGEKLTMRVHGYGYSTLAGQIVR